MINLKSYKIFHLFKYSRHTFKKYIIKSLLVFNTGCRLLIVTSLEFARFLFANSVAIIVYCKSSCSYMQYPCERRRVIFTETGGLAYAIYLQLHYYDCFNRAQ